MRLLYNLFPLVFLYNIFVLFYTWLLRVASVRNAKARAWVQGRKGLFIKLEKSLCNNTAPLIWVHSASTGEFEQAKPLIEALRKRYPQYKILVTFFSPSGYEAAGRYAGIDFCFYLPADTAVNAQRFVQTVKPALVIFSKYDFWHHYLKTINERHIPLLLISAVFRKNQLFFRPYGGFNRAMLRRFTHIFVQDKASQGLLNSIGIPNCSISGDTRFDRVMDIVKDKDAGFKDTSGISLWLKGRPCIVAGSTWPGDEAMLAAAHQHFPKLALIVVPHEINEAHIIQLRAMFPSSLLFSKINDAFPVRPVPGTALWEAHETVDGKQLQHSFYNTNVLIVDAIGLLARMYAMAAFTYVGGGFTKDGIHNTLEAAVWGKPVIIGPNYKKYREAKELIAAGGACSVANAAQLQRWINHFINSKAALEAASDAAKQYVQNGAGATAHIMCHIQENRLLTN